MANLKAALSNTSFLKKLRKALGLGEELTAINPKPTYYDAISVTVSGGTSTYFAAVVKFPVNVEQAVFVLKDNISFRYSSTYAYFSVSDFFDINTGIKFLYSKVSSGELSGAETTYFTVDNDTMSITFPGTYYLSFKNDADLIGVYVYE
jgi:hypothetical protein